MDKMWEEMQIYEGNYRNALEAYNGSEAKATYADFVIDLAQQDSPIILK